jgi:hypothetical protein
VFAQEKLQKNKIYYPNILVQITVKKSSLFPTVVVGTDIGTIQLGALPHFMKFSNVHSLIYIPWKGDRVFALLNNSGEYIC